MKNILLTAIILFVSQNIWAQFKRQGSIEFVCSENKRLSLQLDADEDFKNSSYYKEYLKTLPTKALTYYKLTYNQNQSTYFFDREEKKTNSYGWWNASTFNVIVKNFTNKTIAAEKELYDKNYIIQDSLPTYKWKIYDEVREIAGYQCRKATTVVHDSVVVVAFYTEQIMVSSGPESFNGLPGMILGLAIPRMYKTWFAVSVNDAQIEETEIKHIKKPKIVSYKTILTDLAERMEDWGKFKNTMLWKLTL